MSKLTLDETRKLKVMMNQLRALCITIEEILTNDTVEPFGRFAGFKSMAKIYNDFVVNAKRLITVPSMIYTLNTNEMPSYGDTLWPQAKAHYESILLLSKMLLATLEGSLDFTLLTLPAALLRSPSLLPTRPLSTIPSNTRC